MPIKRVDFDVLAFIVSINKKQFTISYIVNAYLASPERQHDSAKSSRQFLYRSIIKLQNKGLLACLPSKSGKANLYALATEESDVCLDKNPPSVHVDPRIEITSRIRDKIKKYKLDLLKTMGETEAYKEWAEEMPTLRNDIQAQYNSAKDESSKLLGKVSAYESLLMMYQGC